MGTLTSQLIVSLKDDVSTPAKKIAKALDVAQKQVKALASAGISDRLGQQLSRLGLSAVEIEKVGAAWKKYSATQKLAADASQWTRTQAAQVRAWENTTVASIRSVIRAEQSLARQQQAAARAAARPAPVVRDQARGGNVGHGIVGTGIAYGGKRFAQKSVVSAAEFDIGVRKQREFVDIPKSVQDQLLVPQAKRIGQDTQFTNLDVIKAQTKAMQGLPASFDAELRAEVGAGILESVKNYALVMEADLEQSSEAIRTFLQTTNKDISSKSKALAEATRATNLMVKMAKLGGMNDDDVQQFMKFGAATGTAANLSDTTLAALGSVGRRGGLRGDELGVFVRAISSKLVAPTSKGLDALTAAGIDFNKYTKMPGGLSTENLANFHKRRFGQNLSDDQRTRLSEILDDGEVVGNREEFTKRVSGILAEGFGKTKNGKTRAQDAQKIAKEVSDFYKLSVKSVDAEGLLNAIMTNPKMTIALLNAMFTDKHGGKGSILASKWGQFQDDKKALDDVSSDPEFAKRKAEEIMGGLGGALERAKGSIENFQLSIGQANEALAKFSLDSFGNALDAISNLPEPVRRLGAEIAAVGAVIGGLKGLQALYGGFGLSTSAAALDGSAAALTRAAVALGGNGVVGSAAGAAGGAVAGGAKKGFLTGALKVGGAAAAALVTLDLLSGDKDGNLWGLTGGIDKWAKEKIGVNPSNLGELSDKGVPGWKRLLFGRAADPDFNAREHFGILLGDSPRSQVATKAWPTPTGADPIQFLNQSSAGGSAGKEAAAAFAQSLEETLPKAWPGAAGPAQFLDQSGPAGSAGAKMGEAFKATFEEELRGVDQMIQRAMQRWSAMLGSFRASPSITPSIGAPAGGSGGGRKLGSLDGLAAKQHASFADYGFRTV